MLKKIINITLMIVVMTPMFLFPVSVKGANPTLQDLIDELEAKKVELDKVNKDKNLTENRISEIKKNISNINDEIIDIEKKVEQLNKDIIRLDGEIIEKNEEAKKIINYYQLSNGENAYLEYIFGSNDITDFIYRVSIVEQLTNYNNELINSMNKLIEESKQKTKDLAKEKINITNKKENLYQEQFKLGDRVENLEADSFSLSLEINDAIKTIENLRKNFNCKPHQRVADCISFGMSDKFVLPLDKGRITDIYGPRNLWFGNIHLTWHSGVDIGGNPLGTPIFPVAAGKVVYIGYTSCGGNYVIIQHNIKGKHYASRYLHLLTVNVRMNQEVNINTVIGGIGGGPGGGDTCTTGAHLDLTIAEGIYAIDFTSFGRYGPIVNPHKILNLPNLGSWFYSRY